MALDAARRVAKIIASVRVPGAEPRTRRGAMHEGQQCERKSHGCSYGNQHLGVLRLAAAFAVQVPGAIRSKAPALPNGTGPRCEPRCSAYSFSPQTYLIPTRK